MMLLVGYVEKKIQKRKGPGTGLPALSGRSDLFLYFLRGGI